MRRLLCGLLLALACAILLISCHDPEPIRVGFSGGLTGRAAGLGTSGRNGFLLAIDQVNAAGGLHGRTIEVLIEDNRMEADTAAETTRKLIEQGVVAIIGPMTSQMATNSVALADQSRIPMISPTVSTNQLQDLDDFFFRVYYANAQAAELLAGRLLTRSGIKRVACLYDLSNRAYTEDWVKIFRTTFEQHGGEVVSAAAFDLKQEPLFSQLAELVLKAEPEGVLILANAVDTALICQQLAKHQARIPIFATGWSYSDDLLQFGGRAVEGLTVIQSANLESTEPNYLAFREAYRQRYREEPNFPAVHAFDATQMLLTALRRNPDPAHLKQTLLATTHQGLLGELRFNRFGDLAQPKLYLARVVDGRFTTLATD